MDKPFQTDAAAGFDATAGILLRRWQLGVGYDRATHGREDTGGDFVVSNIFVEPRVSFANGTSRLTPYAAVRLGRAMATYETVVGITDKATGYMAGVGGGALWFIANHVQADAEEAFRSLHRCPALVRCDLPRRLAPAARTRRSA